MNPPPAPARHAGIPRYRSKTLATWVAVTSGALGGLRFYLHGPRDLVGWLHWPPTLLGLWGAWRMDALGQDDRLGSLLVPLLGLMLSWAMLSAIVTGLTPDARWDERHNPGRQPRATGWGPVLGAIAALMLGGIALVGTIAFAGQRFFEWQQESATRPAAPRVPLKTG